MEGEKMEVRYLFYQLGSGEKTSIELHQSGGETTRLSIIPTALVCLRVNDKVVAKGATGENVLDALFKGFCQAAGVADWNLVYCRIIETFWLDNNCSHIVANASVKIQADKENREMEGFGKDGDSRKAFLLALVAVANQIKNNKGGDVFLVDV